MSLINKIKELFSTENNYICHRCEISFKGSDFGGFADCEYPDGEKETGLVICNKCADDIKIETNKND